MGSHMKQPPKTPIEFDYDLWTTEDGKCMVRVKITGEITEVDREVMKVKQAFTQNQSVEKQNEDAVWYPRFVRK